MTIFFFAINAAACAVTVALYADDPNPIGLACIVFSGFVALLFLALAVTE